MDLNSVEPLFSGHQWDHLHGLVMPVKCHNLTGTLTVASHAPMHSQKPLPVFVEFCLSHINHNNNGFEFSGTPL